MSANNKVLYEYPFAPEKEPQAGVLAYCCDSAIKSAIYNSNGSQIIITTENGLVFTSTKKKIKQQTMEAYFMRTIEFRYSF